MLSAYPPPPVPHRHSSSHHHTHHHHRDDFADDFHHHQSFPSHHFHSDINSTRSRESMANLVGSVDPHSRHRPRGRRVQEIAARFTRSRSSPPVTRRGGLMRNNNHHWSSSQGELNFGASREALTPGFLHSSFHDLHAANEVRASRHDLRELREMLRQNQTGDKSLRSSRRSFRERKWPPPSPNCRRCLDGFTRY